MRYNSKEAGFVVSFLSIARKLLSLTNTLCSLDLDAFFKQITDTDVIC